MIVEPWDADLYERFIHWRTQPSRDLAGRIELDSPEFVVDLGCGTGNSTAVCRERWPRSRILGIDSSASMLDRAHESNVEAEFRHESIESWLCSEERADVLFSAAALQWVKRHELLFPSLIGRVNEGGALAVQMPDYQAPAHIALRQLADSPLWAQSFASGSPEEWVSHAPHIYFDLLTGRSRHVEVWRTEYMHPVESLKEIVQWYSATGLRPYRDALQDPETWQRFLLDYREVLTDVYPELASGARMLSIPRIFVVAYR